MHPRVEELLAKTYDDQRSPEWFALRGNMLTASDVAAAIGVNFFKHPETLVLEKCGYKKFYGNSDTERGIRLESHVRELYDMTHNKKTHEIGLFVHPMYSWLGGSPDGVTEDGILVEIKCPKKISSTIPKYYYPQVQLLLEVLDLEMCDFIQFCEETQIMKVIRVDRDRKWFNDMFPVMEEFWKRVLHKREHGLCEIISAPSP